MFFIKKKNKMIFFHSNREITSFNTAKNVKDESANKLTSSKLITYNDIMHTKIYDKIKVIHGLRICNIDAQIFD